MNERGRGARRRMPVPAAGRAASLFAACAIAMVAVAGPAAPAAGMTRSNARLHYDPWRIDAPLLAAGLSGMVLANAIATDTQIVPAAGFDPARIHWQLDRNSLRDINSRADTRSNTLRDVSLVLPVALGIVTAAPGNRLRAGGDRVAVWVESAAVAQGITNIIKNSASRPRPFTYQPEARRPDTSRYDVLAPRAFESMPSGHASSAWCAAAVLWMDPWLDAPDATWKRRAGVACAGSMIAMAAGGLRVEAGQHFPTDVAAGAAIGAASGTLVPLWHGYTLNGARLRRPTARQWLDRGIGVAAGIGLGVLVTEALGDR